MDSILDVSTGLEELMVAAFGLDPLLPLVLELVCYFLILLGLLSFLIGHALILSQ
jgi:hypothetical protein